MITTTERTLGNIIDDNLSMVDSIKESAEEMKSLTDKVCSIIPFLKTALSLLSVATGLGIAVLIKILLRS
jgi:hypothetical protein